MTLSEVFAGHNCRRLPWQRLPRLFYFTDADRMPDPLPAIAGLPRGSGVIFRHYGIADRQSLGARIGDICRHKQLVFLVAGDFCLARILRADGLHLPEGMVGRAGGRQSFGRGILTVAAHSKKAVHQACRLQPDAIFLSPVFPTQSHPRARTLGALRFAEICRAVNVPIYALGGVTGDNWQRLRFAGAAGVGAIGAVSGN